MMLSRKPTTISCLFFSPKRHDRPSLAIAIIAMTRHMRDKPAASRSKRWNIFFIVGLPGGGTGVMWLRGSVDKMSCILIVVSLLPKGCEFLSLYGSVMPSIARLVGLICV